MATETPKKILVTIFNRAHYGRLRSVLKAIQNHPKLELQVMAAVPAAHGNFLTNWVHSKPHTKSVSWRWYLRAFLLSWTNPRALQQSDFLLKHILQDGFPVNSSIPMFLDGGMPETMAKSVGLGMFRIVDELKRLKPDVVFVNADRFEMMAVTLAAAYLNIPIAHNEGGDVSGSIDESIRHAITKFAHLHFTATETSKKRVIQMGEDPKFVFNVGSPVIDTLKTLDLRSAPAVSGIDFQKPYLVVLVHPVATDTGENNHNLVKKIIQVVGDLNMQTIFLGSNNDAQSDKIGSVLRNWNKSGSGKPKNVLVTKHLPPDDFYRVLAGAACLIGNSSSFIREGAFLGTPAVIVGSRQQNRDCGQNVKEVPADEQKIKQTVLEQIKRGRYPSDPIFGGGKSGQRIAELLVSVRPNLQKQFKEL